jgi:alkylation response protein AidB-like acyl-CoA dehydrogenase
MAVTYSTKIFNSSFLLFYLGSGSDAASLTTSATFDEKSQEYIINGNKSFISGAGMSTMYLVMCKVKRDGKEGITCLIVPNGTKGLSFGADEKKMGWKVQPTKQVILEDVRVPISNRWVVSC